MKKFYGNQNSFLTSDQKAALDAVIVNTSYYNKHVVTADEETSGVITVPAYTVGANLMVFVQAILACIIDDYAETNATTITFVADRLTEGNVLIFRG